MKGWAMASITFVFVSAFCFGLYILFNFVLYNPTSGIDTILDNLASDHFNPTNLAKYTSTSNTIATAFGFSGILCLGLAFLCYLASCFSKPELET